MSDYSYILIGTKNKNATFIMKGDEITFFEIFQLFDNVKDVNNQKKKNNIIVSAINQQEALKKFRSIYPDLMKRSNKDYYEAVLII